MPSFIDLIANLAKLDVSIPAHHLRIKGGDKMKDYLFLFASSKRPLINSPLRVRFHFFSFVIASSNSTVIEYFSTRVELPFYRTRIITKILLSFSNLSFDLVPCTYLPSSFSLSLSSRSSLCPFDLIKQVNKYTDVYVYIFIDLFDNVMDISVDNKRIWFILSGSTCSGGST